ncbi:transglycosylase [Streptomyces tateyamensis]|uniref:Transglycosylase n=1 Tax=Streptomyces tateyamensis TaxID=565073 RepID=A0A2V4P0E7_9ACTN|nr:transglycosylase family protein [Streptomyces tateyamensis]PYC82736.1 transglycosylase [Streptomyces tateyamensis]
MFTGTGRHRRRSTAEMALAVAGVAGAGLAIPLLTATGAHAAPVPVWDKVASCESTGNWSINSGNGFYGGLQFTSSTWAAYGGTQYAPRADQASKDQQIAVAERVLAGQGPGAWPVCSVKAGLARSGSAPQLDTGAQGTPSSPAPRAKSAPRPVTPSPAPQSAKAAAPVGIPAAPATVSPAKPAAAHGYTVKSGDTLSKIAQARQILGGWQELYRSNRAVVGADPDLILPGQVLDLG